MQFASSGHLKAADAFSRALRNETPILIATFLYGCDVRIGFVTCSDLSRYFVSSENALLTHDDQVAFNYLKARGAWVAPLVWGTPVSPTDFDVLVVRSPWDYMDSEHTRDGFFRWLEDLDQKGVRLLNSFPVLKWNLDKHYLAQLATADVPTVPTRFLEATESLDALDSEFIKGSIVIKPCVAAAAKDAMLVETKDDLQATKSRLREIRRDRAFMIQPFIETIRTCGEWSLVFLNEEYSHAVRKLPKAGGWIVQDELGGSVHSEEPPCEVRQCAEDAYQKLCSVLHQRFGAAKSPLLYARVDVLPTLQIGELELVEPELFFLDRRTLQPNKTALEKFAAGLNL